MNRCPTMMGICLAALVALTCASCCSGPCEEGWPELSGPYLGQEPPGAEAKIFAPGLIATGVQIRDIAITPDGKEIYFCAILGSYDWFGILVTREVDGKWTEPEVAPFSGKYNDLEPAISPDGSRFLFMSNRPLEEGGEIPEQSDIWAMDRTGDGWGEPYNLGMPVCSPRPEYFPSLTSDGTLYFTREGEGRANRIWRSRLVDGGYAEPEMLGPEVNSTPSQFNSFIAADESYLIYSTVREDTLGGVDYYISFRDEDDNWTGPINMGDRINTPANLEWSPFVTRDGKYLFFMAGRSRFPGEFPVLPVTYAKIRQLHGEPGSGLSTIYWIDAGFIEDLRPRGEE